MTSPLKTAVAAESEVRDEVGARRNLDAAMSESANAAALMVWPGSTAIPFEAQALAGTVQGATPPLPPAYVSPRDIKKQRKGCSPLKKSNDKMTTLAGSDQGFRQAQ